MDTKQAEELIDMRAIYKFEITVSYHVPSDQNLIEVTRFLRETLKSALAPATAELEPRGKTLSINPRSIHIEYEDSENADLD